MQENAKIPFANFFMKTLRAIRSVFYTLLFYNEIGIMSTRSTVFFCRKHEISVKRGIFPFSPGRKVPYLPRIPKIRMYNATAIAAPSTDAIATRSGETGVFPFTFPVLPLM